MAFETPWIGTSWKMNKVRAEARAYAEALKTSDLSRSERVGLFLIPPFTAIADVADLLRGTRVTVGAQNMHWDEDGAWTGEISARMIEDVGATLVEIGHSERRTNFGETDETVALKTAAAVKRGLTALVCVGDTRDEYDAGRTAQALDQQVRAATSLVTSDEADRVVIAYEPVWSIGAGGTPADPGFANEQHRMIKSVLQETVGRDLRVLYGGSVNPGNCVALAAQPHIDGLFIGRSAWEADGFIGIVRQVLGA